MALINVSGLSFAYESTPVLQNVNLSVAPGEKLAILGGNGSGKSTLAQWIAGWLPRGSYAANAGEVTVEGQPWAELDAATRAGAVQFVGQVPMQQLSGFSFTVRDEIAFGPGNLALPEAKIRARVDAAVEICNLGHLLDRDPFSLSGGEQQRLSIAAALAMQPRALVLDEPTGNFDPESREALLAQLEKLPGALAIVWCDVTLGAPLSVAERVLLLDGGRIAYDGDVAGLLTHPRTAEIFGLPAVAQTALMLRERGLWPAEAPISMDVGRVASALRPMLESAR